MGAAIPNVNITVTEATSPPAAAIGHQDGNPGPPSPALMGRLPAEIKLMIWELHITSTYFPGIRRKARYTHLTAPKIKYIGINIPIPGPPICKLFHTAVTRLRTTYVRGPRTTAIYPVNRYYFDPRLSENPLPFTQARDVVVLYSNDIWPRPRWLNYLIYHLRLVLSGSLNAVQKIRLVSKDDWDASLSAYSGLTETHPIFQKSMPTDRKRGSQHTYDPSVLQGQLWVRHDDVE
ncbi:hypothetical protein MKZ38_000312 [Zalerion maritima]|uniref:Uncharacterized protein n=1 Tax=Zalerion maritima TaxID=339359 RepID=A0AAD5WS55_9PEZI|nr:hypothetical protein MKZ38_000312 [Zalerion maritima]